MTTKISEASPTTVDIPLDEYFHVYRTILRSGTDDNSLSDQIVRITMDHLHKFDRDSIVDMRGVRHGVDT